MTSGKTFSPDVAEPEVRKHANWNWLISCATENINEHRQDWSASRFDGLSRLTMRRTQFNVAHRFTLSDGQNNEETDWSELGATIGRFISPGSAILLDTSHFGFDKLLYLLPALRATRPARLGCFYVAPENFREIENDSLAVQETQPIGQPKGYVSLTSMENRSGSRHVVLLGFDKGRAWKFIQRYDWDDAHLHLVVGDPAFVARGESIALNACEPWLTPFRRAFPEHIHPLPASEPEGVAAFLNEQFSSTQWLDIVPLGPKPMLLGVLAFYFGLAEHDRERVRLLYDFSEQRACRCDGVKNILFWDCSGFPNL